MVDGVLQQNEPLKIQWWLNEGTEAMGEKTWKKKHRPKQTTGRIDGWLACRLGPEFLLLQPTKKLRRHAGKMGLGPWTMHIANTL